MAMGHGSDDSGSSIISNLVNALSDSLWLKLSLLGICFVVVGYFIQFGEITVTNTGVWSAVLAIWGTALFLFGALIYAVIWRSHQ